MRRVADSKEEAERGSARLARGRLVAALLVISSTAAPCAFPGEVPALPYVGYTEFRTNLPGGRQPNIATMRACVVRADGSERREIGSGLADAADSWTQFAGWSPDGRLAIVGAGWESPENAAWEEAHKAFRMTEGWRYDMYLLDLGSGSLENVTAVDRVSDYNTGLFFFPGDSTKLGFQALINGESHPYVMDGDGHHKRDINSGPEGFTYGYSASPDGAHVAYHKDYQVYVAQADGSNALHIDTGNSFNFCPLWSPDGSWLLFLSGEHYNCHPTIVRPDGSGLRKVADRGGYPGTVEFLDVPDFHGGSSDTPVWGHDGKWIYYTAKVGDSVELMRVSVDGRPETLTHSPSGTKNYHPAISPDGRLVAFGSTRTGVRQLYVMPVDGGEPRAITRVAEGHGAMWPRWQPPGNSAGVHSGD